MERNSLLAVAFSLLLLASVVSMSGAAAAIDDSPDRTGSHPQVGGLAGSENLALNDSDSPLDNTTSPKRPSLTDDWLGPRQRLALANFTLHEFDMESDRRQRSLKKARTQLGTSLQYYNRSRATDRRAFDSQARALHAIARASGGSSDDTLRNVSAGIFLASNNSARYSIIDANRSLEVFEDDLDRNERRFVERAIRNARSASDRAESAAERPKSHDQSSLRRNVRAKADAVDHYRSAYHHANRALDRIEREVKPELELSQGRAFENNGTVLVRVRASIQDVRPSAYDTATVTDADRNQLDAIDLRPGPSANRTANGTALIDIGSDHENRTITAESTASHDSSRAVEESLEINVSEDDVVPERPDPNEFNEVTIENESSGVTVSAGGQGLWEPDLRVTDETPTNDSAPRAGPVVQIRNRTAVDEASVTIPLSDDVEPGANVSIYTWDPRTSAGWTPVETEIDHQNGTATAQVDHFSFFSVFFADRWKDFMTERIELEDRHFAGDGNGTNTNTSSSRADLMFVVDESGSMGGDPIQFAKLASHRFVAALHDDEQAGLVGYSGSATLHQSLTTDHDSLNASISNLGAGGGTDTEAGIRRAINELEASEHENRSRQIVLLSDGQSNSGSNPRDAAETAAADGIEINTVGLGSYIDENELKDVANITGGDFYHVQNAEDLPDTFERVAENRTDRRLKDTSGDGIPDAVAEANPRLPGLFGVLTGRIDIDPTLADTSGDGLLDNETIDVQYRILEDGNDTILETRVTDAVADPGQSDTDGDGLSDYEEVEKLGTNAWLWDTSGDGYNDLIDPNPLEQTQKPRVNARSDNWGRYQILNVENGQLDSVEAEARFDPSVPWNDPFWSDSAGNVIYIDSLDEDELEAIQFFYPEIKPNDDILVTFDEHGWLDEDPKKVRVRINGDGIQSRYTIDVTSDQPEVVKGAIAVGAVGTATPEPVSSGTGLLLIGGTVATVAIADAVAPEVLGGSEQGVTESTVAVGTVLNSETEAVWERSDGPTIVFPSGDTYTHGQTGHERRWGSDQVFQLPGIQDSEDVGEIVENGEELPGRGDYDLIIGDNPNGEGQVVLRLLEGMVVSASATAPIDDYRGRKIGVNEGINHILNRNNWDHNKLGQSEEEVRETLRKVLQNPDEVYESSQGTYYIKEMFINGDKVIVMVLVAHNSNTAYPGREVITGYVPAGGQPTGSTYEQAYDRQRAIEIIRQTLEREEPLEKIREIKEIIEDIDIGDYI